MKLKIDEMFAFVADDTEGEGVMVITVDGQSLPLVGADMDRVKSLAGIAEMIKKESGKDYKILKFSTREDITKEVLNDCK